MAAQSEWQRVVPVLRVEQTVTNRDIDASKTVRAVRLIFEYDEDRVRLVTEQPVEIAGANLQLATTGDVGMFVDTRTVADITLTRVQAKSAFGTSVEIFPERHDEPITRSDVSRPTGAFTVVVPISEDADHITLVRVAAPPGDAAGIRVALPEVSDLATFRLTARR